MINPRLPNRPPAPDPAPSLFEGLEVLEVAAGEVLLERDPNLKAPERLYALVYLVEGVALSRFRPVAGTLLDRMRGDGPPLDVVVGLFGDRQWLGTEALWSGVNAVLYEALSPCRYVVVPHERIEADTTRETWASLTFEAARQVSFHNMHKLLGQVPLRRLVLYWLSNIRLSTELPEIAIRQADLASLVGVGRTRLSGVLAELEAEGLIERGYGEILVGGQAELFEAFGA